MVEIETTLTKSKVNDTSSLNEAYTVNQNYICFVKLICNCSFVNLKEIEL